jgi:hypothetical protein
MVERDPITDCGQELVLGKSRRGFRDEERRRRDPRLDIAAHQRPPAAIFVLKLLARECAERVQVARVECLPKTIAAPRRGVRRDACGGRPQLLEAHPRDIQVLDLEQLRADDSAALLQHDAHADGLELAAVPGTEQMADFEDAVGFHSDDVEPLDEYVRSQLEERGDEGDILVGAAEATDAGAPMIVRRSHRAAGRGDGRGRGRAARMY